MMKRYLGVVALSVGLAVAPLAGEEVGTPVGPWGGGVSSLAVHPGNPQILYAATRTGGLFKSINGGVSWERANHGLPSSIVEAVAIAPSAPDTIYVVVTTGGFSYREIWRSTDGGASWEDLTGEGVSLNIVGSTLTVHPRNPRIVFAGSYGLYRTSDGGTSWSHVETSFYLDTLILDPARPSTLYAGSDQGVFKSTDGGLSWRSSSTGLEGTSVRALALMPGDSRVLYAATPAGVFKSTDAGGRWQRRSGGLTEQNVLSLLAAPSARGIPATLWAGTENGVFRSRNGAASWERASRGLRNGFVTSLAVHPRNPRILWAAAPGGGLFKTANGGERWLISDRGLSARLVWSFAVDPETPGVFWAVVSYAGVWRSPDGGVTWQERSRGLPKDRAGNLAIDPREPGTVWFATREGLFSTVNDGLTWQRNAELDLEGGHPTSVVHFDPQDSQSIWIGTDRGLFRSADHGATWTRVPGIDDSVLAFLLDPEDPQVLHASVYFPGLLTGGLRRTTDGGTNWNIIQVPDDDYTILTLVRDPAEHDRLFAGGQSAFYESGDGGETWEIIRRPDYPVGIIRPLLFDPDDGSVWIGADGLHHFSRDGAWSLVILSGTVMDLDLDPRHPDALLVTIYGRGGLRIER